MLVTTAILRQVGCSTVCLFGVSFRQNIGWDLMYVVINGVVCMAFDSISGPRQCRSLQKLEMMIVAVFGTVLCLAVARSFSCCRTV